MVYFCYSSSLNVCVAYIVLDSRLATLWESNFPFGFPLVMFPLGSSYFVFMFVSDGRHGIIVSVPDHCLPFPLEIYVSY